ncbi:MAG TPA: FAD-dependent oxidoreductase, partial [Candidatus Deferrimicrobium sp.]|nr:FAD-dependent oxidoreductase [Candidatus Deferrimicrobium sp.]
VRRGRQGTNGHLSLLRRLLKPGGYLRINQLAEELEPILDNEESGKINLDKLKTLAESAVSDADFLKEKRSTGNRKIERKLPITDCFVAPCSAGCPIGQDISEYIDLVNQAKYEEAFATIVRKNPLPFITGTICNHKCMSKCTRLDYDESVQIRSLKLVAAEKGYGSYLQNMCKPKAEKNTKIAIIGAGPSGLAAGYFLAKGGLDVTIFDKRNQAGGTVQYVIPEFRITRGAIENDIEFVKRAGAKFEFGVDPNFSINQLKDQGFKYVYLAIGAGKSSSLSLEGDVEVKGAIPFLEEFNQNPDINLGENVAVIGGGNSAMDAARAALRVKNVSKVYVVYRRTKEYMPADQEELDLAMGEGVIFQELLAPLALQNGILKCQRMALGEPDSSGRRSPVATEEVVELAVDTVLSATGEMVDYELLRKNGFSINELGGIMVNPETLETSVKNVFIGGDALYGPSTVVEAINHASKACAAILERESLMAVAVDGKSEPSAEKLAAIAARKGVLESVKLGDAEAARCLDCNTVCNVCTEVCPNRANVVLAVSAQGLKNNNQILHIDGMCNECGNCATFCPNNGAPYKDKLTLFWNEGDFMNSTNPGFLLVSAGDEPVFKVRLEGNTGEVKLSAKGLVEGSIAENVAAIVWGAYENYGFLFNPCDLK